MTSPLNRLREQAMQVAHDSLSIAMMLDSDSPESVERIAELTGLTHLQVIQELEKVRQSRAAGGGRLTNVVVVVQIEKETS